MTKAEELEMTIAQNIAAKLDNDGTVFETASGLTLSDLADMEDRLLTRDGESWRYTFTDGSEIYGNAAGWDIKRPRTERSR